MMVGADLFHDDQFARCGVGLRWFGSRAVGFGGFGSSACLFQRAPWSDLFDCLGTTQRRKSRKAESDALIIATTDAVLAT